MEYVYAAMLLHKAGQKIDDAGIVKVLEAAGAKVDPAKAKAVAAALDGQDIEKLIEESQAVPVAAAPAASVVEEPAGKEKKVADEAKAKEDEKKNEEQAAAGLGSLFG